jgi:hypothetical protein
MLNRSRRTVQAEHRDGLRMLLPTVYHLLLWLLIPPCSSHPCQCGKMEMMAHLEQYPSPSPSWLDNKYTHSDVQQPEIFPAPAATPDGFISGIWTRCQPRWQAPHTTALACSSAAWASLQQAACPAGGVMDPWQNAHEKRPVHILSYILPQLYNIITNYYDYLRLTKIVPKSSLKDKKKYLILFL